MRFYDVNDGCIKLDGHDVREFNRRELRSAFGMVLQDTWLKLRSKGEVETTIEARNKLVTVLRNVCIDHLRKAREIPIDVTVDIQAYRMDEEDIGNLEQLLQEGLTPLQKEIFNLVTHEGFDYDEIAKQLSMSVEAVRMNMSRTRKKIRENYKRLNR